MNSLFHSRTYSLLSLWILSTITKIISKMTLRIFYLFLLLTHSLSVCLPWTITYFEYTHCCCCCRERYILYRISRSAVPNYDYKISRLIMREFTHWERDYYATWESILWPYLIAYGFLATNWLFLRFKKLNPWLDAIKIE
jgi:hypothetical protein